MARLTKIDQEHQQAVKAKEERAQARAERAYAREKNAHLRKFPHPTMTDGRLVYRGISVPLEGGHWDIYGSMYMDLAPTETGWESTPLTIEELGKAGSYANEASVRAAKEKLRRKLLSFEKVGLKISLRGNYHNALSMKFVYEVEKAHKRTGTK